jgi:hypothetical protein
VLLTSGGKSMRFFLAVLAIAGLNLLLQRIEEWGAGHVDHFMLARHVASSLPQEIDDVLAQSAERERQLPGEWRAKAFRLGYLIGLVARFGILHSNGVKQGEVHTSLAAELLEASGLAEEMGLAPANWPPTRTLKELMELPLRFEADETGIAGRVERKLTVRHRHLFLGGVHVGMDHAAFLIAKSEGVVFEGLGGPAGRHIALAGLPRSVWEPLTRPPEGDNPDEILSQFQKTLTILNQAVAEPVYH